jgi:hypothetical protein
MSALRSAFHHANDRGHGRAIPRSPRQAQSTRRTRAGGIRRSPTPPRGLCSRRESQAPPSLSEGDRSRCGMICSESGRINGVATEGLTEEISPHKMQDRTLVERERELRELARLIDDARAGDGRLALIEGPAGIGKTRLFHEVRPYAEEVGVRILAARGGELERDFGFGIVRQLLEPVLQRSDPETRADLLAGAARSRSPPSLRRRARARVRPTRPRRPSTASTGSLPTSPSSRHCCSSSTMSTGPTGLR